jgi:hypothetical protein
MARTAHTPHLSLSPEFTSWLDREKKLASRRQAMIRGFAFALLLMLMTAVLLNRFGEDNSSPGNDSYTHVEYSNF